MTSEMRSLPALQSAVAKGFEPTDAEHLSAPAAAYPYQISRGSIQVHAYQGVQKHAELGGPRDVVWQFIKKVQTGGLIRLPNLYFWGVCLFAFSLVLTSIAQTQIHAQVDRSRYPNVFQRIVFIFTTTAVLSIAAVYLLAALQLSTESAEVSASAVVLGRIFDFPHFEFSGLSLVSAQIVISLFGGFLFLFSLYSIVRSATHSLAAALMATLLFAFFPPLLFQSANGHLSTMLFGTFLFCFSVILLKSDSGTRIHRNLIVFARGLAGCLFLIDLRGGILGASLFIIELVLSSKSSTFQNLKTVFTSGFSAANPALQYVVPAMAGMLIYVVFQLFEHGTMLPPQISYDFYAASKIGVAPVLPAYLTSLDHYSVDNVLTLFSGFSVFVLLQKLSKKQIAFMIIALFVFSFFSFALKGPTFFHIQNESSILLMVMLFLASFIGLFKFSKKTAVSLFRCQKLTVFLRQRGMQSLYLTFLTGFLFLASFSIFFCLVVGYPGNLKARFASFPDELKASHSRWIWSENNFSLGQFLAKVAPEQAEIGLWECGSVALAVHEYSKGGLSESVKKSSALDLSGVCNLEIRSAILGQSPYLDRKRMFRSLRTVSTVRPDFLIGYGASQSRQSTDSAAAQLAKHFTQNFVDDSFFRFGSNQYLSSLGYTPIFILNSEQSYFFWVHENIWAGFNSALHQLNFTSENQLSQSYAVSENIVRSFSMSWQLQAGAVGSIP